MYTLNFIVGADYEKLPSSLVNQLQDDLRKAKTPLLQPLSFARWRRTNKQRNRIIRAFVARTRELVPNLTFATIVHDFHYHCLVMRIFTKQGYGPRQAEYDQYGFIEEVFDCQHHGHNLCKPKHKCPGFNLCSWCLSRHSKTGSLRSCLNNLERDLCRTLQVCSFEEFMDVHVNEKTRNYVNVIKSKHLAGIILDYALEWGDETKEEKQELRKQLLENAIVLNQMEEMLDSRFAEIAKSEIESSAPKSESKINNNSSAKTVGNHKDTLQPSTKMGKSSAPD